MIYMIAGRPKSGKTYEAVKYHIIPSLSSGRKVVSNVALDIDYFAKQLGENCRELINLVGFNYTSEFDSKSAILPFSRPVHYMDDWRDEEGRGPLFVIDEAHFSIPKVGTSKELINFFTMHGHYGIDILLMTQHPGQIDKSILNLVEIVYRTIKATAFGSKNSYIKKVQDGFRGGVVNTEIRKYDKSVFPFYKSHTQSKKAVVELSARDIKPFWRHWSFVGVIVCSLVSVFLFVRLFTSDSKDAKKSTTKTQAASQDHSQSNLSPGSPAKSSPLASADQVIKFKPPQHPFHKVQLHITGASTYGKTGSAVNHVYFAATQGERFLFELDDRALKLAGYDIKVLHDCLVILTFKDTYQDYLTCDAPEKQFAYHEQSDTQASQQ